jgi:hypothetical protein
LDCYIFPIGIVPLWSSICCAKIIYIFIELEGDLPCIKS